MSQVDSLVLGTVNAPYSKKLDAHTLAKILLDPALMKVAAGPMSSFFYDVKPELQVAFARHHHIPMARFNAAAKAMSEWSHRTVPVAVAA